MKKNLESLYKEKQKLRRWYKLYKNKVVKWEDIPKDIRELLIKYYGVGDCGNRP